MIFLSLPSALPVTSLFTRKTLLISPRSKISGFYPPTKFFPPDFGSWPLNSFARPRTSFLDPAVLFFVPISSRTSLLFPCSSYLALRSCISECGHKEIQVIAERDLGRFARGEKRVYGLHFSLPETFLKLNCFAGQGSAHFIS